MNDHKAIDQKLNIIPHPCNETDKLGLAIETIGKMPINGLRHTPENGTCGWYIWCGEELSTSADFFKPVHVNHIAHYLPEIEQYLALPPGYRFLIASAYIDIWQDATLTCT